MKRNKPNIWLSLLRKLGRWIDVGVKQLLVIAVIVLGIMHYTGFKWDRSIAKEVDEKTPLMSNEEARLIFNALQQLIVLQQQGKETKVYTGVRKGTVTQMKDGEVKLDIPTKGFTIEPGLVMGASDGLRIGGDIQYAYWKRWGLLVGATVPVEGRSINRIRGHLGLSWSPYLKYIPNTSVWGGVDTNKSPIFGVRTRF